METGRVSCPSCGYVEELNGKDPSVLPPARRQYDPHQIAQLIRQNELEIAEWEKKKPKRSVIVTSPRQTKIGQSDPALLSKQEIPKAICLVAAECPQSLVPSSVLGAAVNSGTRVPSSRASITLRKLPSDRQGGQGRRPPGETRIGTQYCVVRLYCDSSDSAIRSICLNQIK